MSLAKTSCSSLGLTLKGGFSPLEALVLGRPNAGKSLFLVNFAAYLGLKEIRVEVLDGEGRARHQRLSIELARRHLVSHTPYKTTALQTIHVDITTAKTAHRLTLTDTVGLTEEISGELVIRRAIAIALSRISQGPMVLHVVDASAVGYSAIETVSLVDDGIARYAGSISTYAILATKMDKESAKAGLERIRERFQGYPIIPISGITRRGFKDVKTFILRHWQ